MIRNPEFPDPSEILKMLTSGAHLPRKIGAPDTQTERVKVAEAVQRMAAANTDNIKIVCIGCGDEAPLLQSAACACGGFVCAHCQALEDDGVCDHTPHVLPEGVMEDDDDQ